MLLANSFSFWFLVYYSRRTSKITAEEYFCTCSVPFLLLRVSHCTHFVFIRRAGAWGYHQKWATASISNSPAGRQWVTHGTLRSCPDSLRGVALLSEADMVANDMALVLEQGKGNAWGSQSLSLTHILSNLHKNICHTCAHSCAFALSFRILSLQAWMLCTRGKGLDIGMRSANWWARMGLNGSQCLWLPRNRLIPSSIKYPALCICALLSALTNCVSLALRVISPSSSHWGNSQRRAGLASLDH